MDVRGYLAERAPWVDRRLDEVLPAPEQPPRTLHRAMRHLLFPGGKRLRPGLAFAAAEALRAAPATALPIATAVELVHAFSLIHDDLPCMDDAATRRGAPSVHVAFGEAVAVLAGDALLALAFESLAQAAGSHPPARVASLVARLAVAAGSRQLVGGQVDDIALDASADPSWVEDVYRRKSAALIAVSIVGGACLAGADAQTLERLDEAGTRIGIAFQIADDLIDRETDEEVSLPRLIGPDAAQRRAAVLLDEALARLEPLGDAAGPLRDLARYAVWRDR